MTLQAQVQLQLHLRLDRRKLDRLEVGAPPLGVSRMQSWTNAVSMSGCKYGMPGLSCCVRVYFSANCRDTLVVKGVIMPAELSPWQHPADL